LRKNRMLRNASGSETKYHVVASFHEDRRNSKKYAVLKEHDVPIQVVQDMISEVLEKVDRGTAELRHILVYTLEDPSSSLPPSRRMRRTRSS